jgi:hypothetical protein
MIEYPESNRTPSWSLRALSENRIGRGNPQRRSLGSSAAEEGAKAKEEIDRQIREPFSIRPNKKMRVLGSCNNN